MSAGRVAPHTVIVGAGAIGACAAFALAKRGAPVTLLDAGEVGGGCSFGNAGLISLAHLPIQRPGVVRQAMKWMFDPDSPLYIAPRLDPGLIGWLWRFRNACTQERLDRNLKSICDLSRGTLELVDEIHERSRGAFFYDKRGYMEVYRTEEGFLRGCANARLVEPFGFRHDEVRRDPLLAIEPALAPDVAGAVWHRHSAFCDPHRFVLAAADLARSLGAAVYERSPVASIEAAGGRVTGVRLTNGRTIAAEVVVLAAGAWSPPLAHALGVKIPMQPAKGYHRDVAHVDPPLNIACVMGEANMVCTPMGGFMRLAGTLEFSGVNLEMRRNRLDMLDAGARRYLRSYAARNGEKPRSEWVGMRPCSPDGLPILGWAPGAQGLLIATGHAMLGLTQAPVTGRTVAECILDGRSAIDITPMRVDRF